jgi:hypothetical protein
MLSILSYDFICSSYKAFIFASYLEPKNVATLFLFTAEASYCINSGSGFSSSIC